MKTFSQKGSLRKRNLPSPSTLRDIRHAVIEYRSAHELWAKPGSIVVTEVRAVDGEPIEPGEYLLHIQEDGFLPKDADRAVTLGEDGKWSLQ